MKKGHQNNNDNVFDEMMIIILGKCNCNNLPLSDSEFGSGSPIFFGLEEPPPSVANHRISSIINNINIAITIA